MGGINVIPSKILLLSIVIPSIQKNFAVALISNSYRKSICFLLVLGGDDVRQEVSL